MAGKKRRPEVRRGAHPERPDASSLLDRFSEQDLRSWQAKSEAYRQYRTRLHFYLAGERQLAYRELVECLRNAAVDVHKFHDHYRIVDLKYSNQPLSPKGSTTRSGRFNYGRDIDHAVARPFPALYVASDHSTAMAEKFGESATAGLTASEISLRKPSSYTAVRVRGELRTVLDISDPDSLTCFVAVIRKCKIPQELQRLARAAGLGSLPLLIRSVEMLRNVLLPPAWRQDPSVLDLPAPSQIFGEIALDAGLCGMVYQSAKGSGSNIAILPQNLEANSSWCELQDEGPEGLVHRRLDGSSLVELCK